MVKRNEEQIHILKYELHHGGFIAYITVRRSDMQWDFRVVNTNANEKFNSKQTAHWEKNIHFIGETEIKEQMRTLIDDCIKNPEEYY